MGCSTDAAHSLCVVLHLTLNAFINLLMSHLCCIVTSFPLVVLLLHNQSSKSYVLKTYNTDSHFLIYAQVLL